jgi:hypothetical protein
MLSVPLLVALASTAQSLLLASTTQAQSLIIDGIRLGEANVTAATGDRYLAKSGISKSMPFLLQVNIFVGIICLCCTIAALLDCISPSATATPAPAQVLSVPP